MRIPILAGNWKMFKTIAEAKKFAEAMPVQGDRVEAIICAPYTMLPALSEALSGKNIALGAQNIHWAEEGAFTGEISPLMLQELGVKYAIIGHSERRAYFGETDETVNQRLHAALKHGIVPIVCVGEDLEQREANQTKEVVKVQMEAAMKDVSSEQMVTMVIAYEPIWAIGTGKTSSAEEAGEVIGFIRQLIADQYDQNIANQVRIQYGGSVKPDNIAGFMLQSDIDGALVGGASLQPDSFLALLKGAEQ
ncbi:triose-phosphate isomerase [Ammoniphilus sp. CFH 90114]|uniref:triose-phosphate isomerase n=1 Tax=Ammoniphilus sp. CFH 90114 TaxID=2493665 RepID=UPI00100E22C6|nr:triose-phosphate isomerase [Ammoniphilus sp. CFH 90114]RXT04045.1 triose-phosphate isomerase [Ammoniphilus sp. CFH 90114]